MDGNSKKSFDNQIYDMAFPFNSIPEILLYFLFL